MIYNDFQDKKLSRLGFGTMRLPEEKRPSACIGCGSWAEIYRQRDEEARKSKNLKIST